VTRRDIQHDVARHLVARASSRQPVTPSEVAALNAVVAQIRGQASEWPLISLLRKLDPESPILAQMDEIARQAGWAQAGSAEILPGWVRPK
jgi:hypothetical protein